MNVPMRPGTRVRMYRGRLVHTVVAGKVANLPVVLTGCGLAITVMETQVWTDVTCPVCRRRATRGEP